ncbi:hypothetical protein K432DRAFT_363146 [Lepidopterella palustris CBS 459.81]|uniref:Pyoverdine/dityrosine biosynthesis protein n=1 Tax=Lepidopterella palustris CBS 459.81 TaxID=1314670 RepID=A0A8E2DZZ6_9PEZI|nr:hypothetical protein K432DRAFT_363146 [Lepidopterella palustris CBS 459.81]
MDIVTILSSQDASSLSTETLRHVDATVLQGTVYDFIFSEVEHLRLSFEILNVLESYSRHIVPKAIDRNGAIGAASVAPFWIGKGKFLPHVYHHVRHRQAIPLTLPAFPCKSPNRVDKVLGHLPDLGEELALCRLDALAKDVGRVYAPGAYVNIATDGVLFNDILGVSDDECWEYGEALKSIIAEKRLTCIRLLQPMNLLGILPGEDVNRKDYLATTDSCRQELERRFAPSEGELTAAINDENDRDTCLTYRGMMRFLESDLAMSAPLAGLCRKAKGRVLRVMARKMMQRSEAFTLAIRTIRPLDVRLSMHPSSGAAKLSISLIPTLDGGFQKSPWHSCVSVGVDGRYRMVHVGEVRDTHDLIYHNGRPWFYRERSHVFEWGISVVGFEPRYPYGMLVKLKAGQQEFQVDLEKYTALVAAQSAVIGTVCSSIASKQLEQTRALF